MPPIDAGRARPPLFAEPLNGHVIHQQGEQNRGPPYETHLIVLLSLLQPCVQGFDSGSTALYPEPHGCRLLARGVCRVL